MSQIVLCADDSVTMQKVAEITFRASDFEYVGARSADEALKLAKENKPAIILADAVMPGKTGYDLCQAAKSDPDLADVPVVMLCGNSEAYDEARGSDVGADAHITKPWDSQVMLDKVKEIVESAGAGVAKPAAAAPAAPAAPPKPAAARPATPKPAAAPASKPAAAKPSRPATPPPVVPAAKPSRPATPPPVKPAPTPAAPSPAPAAVAAEPTMRPPMIKGTPTKRPSLPGLQGPAGASLGDGGRSATLMGMPSIKMPPGGQKNIPGVTSIESQGGGVNSSSAAAAATSKAAAAAAVDAIPAAAAAAARDAGLDPNGPEMQALVKISREVVERIVWEVVPDLAETIIKENLDKLTAR